MNEHYIVHGFLIFIELDINAHKKMESDTKGIYCRAKNGFLIWYGWVSSLISDLGFHRTKVESFLLDRVLKTERSKRHFPFCLQRFKQDHYQRQDLQIYRFQRM